MPSGREMNPFLKQEVDNKRFGANKGSICHESIASLRQGSRNSMGTFCLLAVVFSLTSLFWASVLLYTTRHTLQFYSMTGEYAEQNQIYGLPIAGYKFIKCGSSVEEAKASGCEYDILANHWIPKPCLDSDAIKAYRDDDSWHPYAQENRTELLSVDVLGELSHYYTSERDHIIHCAMLWRKQYTIFSAGRKNVDSITADPVHTHHCIKYLIDMTDKGQDFREVALTVNVGFGGCFLG